MDYKIDVSRDKTHVIARPLINISKNLVLQMGKELAQLAGISNLQNVLFDFREIKCESSTIEKYEFAYGNAAKVGFKHDWKYAILVDGPDPTRNFLETVMVNAGFICRIFEQEDAAIAWLTEED